MDLYKIINNDEYIRFLLFLFIFFSLSIFFLNLNEEKSYREYSYN